MRPERSHTRRPRPHGALAVVSILLASDAWAQAGAAGLSAVRAHRFGSENGAVSGSYGVAVATGDFNGDGADDLASGAMDYPEGPEAAWGAVEVRYGQIGRGLANALPVAVLGQFVAGSADPAEDGDWFGRALVTCDLNGDSFDDLAVGVPGETLLVSSTNFLSAGLVEVYYGASGGLPALSSVRLRERGAPGEPDLPSTQTNFGWALACGDFDGDGFDDLAVGLPFRNLAAGQDVGRVNVFPGSAAGVGASWVVLDQALLGDGDSGDANEAFAFDLAAGDFDGDGDDDLAIGMPRESNSGGGATPVPEGGVSGAIQFVHGGPGGLPSGSYLLRALDIDSSIGGIELGSALAVGDFDDDGMDDLVAGWPASTVSDQTLAGNALLLYGSTAVMDLKRTQRLCESCNFGALDSKAGERFGYGVAAGDWNGDGVDDLALGAIGEDFGAETDLGEVYVLTGAAGTGILTGTSKPYMFFLPGHFGVPRNPAYTEWDVYWGEELAAGDFDGNGTSDLAVGVQEEHEYDGSVTILYGALFADGFEIGATVLWSSHVP